MMLIDMYSAQQKLLYLYGDLQQSHRVPYWSLYPGLPFLAISRKYAGKIFFLFQGKKLNGGLKINWNGEFCIWN